MKKNLVIPFVITLSLISFVSAYGFYWGFSPSSFLDSIDSSTMILGVVFFTSLLLINFSLKRTFKDNKIAGFGSVIFSLLIVWGVNRQGWVYNFEYLFYDLGISEGFLFTIFIFGIIIGGIYLITTKKISLSLSLIIIGGSLTIASFTDVIYDDAKGITLIIGAILLITGFVAASKQKKQELTFALR